jgi:hypothetical protein
MGGVWYYIDVTGFCSCTYLSYTNERLSSGSLFPGMGGMDAIVFVASNIDRLGLVVQEIIV